MKTFKSILSLFFLTLCVSTPSFAESKVYTIDAVHSGVQFKIRHFLNKVPGSFSDFSGEIHFNPENPESSQAVATISVASVDTRNDDRDAHLQNEDFFLSETYPTIEFKSTNWEVIGENTFKVTGDLTILGKTHPVVLDVVYYGEIEGRGKLRSGWEGKATIDRTQWGLSYGATVGTIGKEVEIELNIQAYREIE